MYVVRTYIPFVERYNFDVYMRIFYTDYNIVLLDIAFCVQPPVRKMCKRFVFVYIYKRCLYAILEIHTEAYRILCLHTSTTYIISLCSFTYAFNCGSISCDVCLHASTHDRRAFRTLSRSSGQSFDCPTWMSKSLNKATWLFISTISCK